MNEQLEREILKALHNEVNAHGLALEQMAKVVNAHTNTLNEWSKQFTQAFARVATDITNILNDLDAIKLKLQTQEQEENGDEERNDGDDCGPGDSVID